MSYHCPYCVAPRVVYFRGDFDDDEEEEDPWKHCSVVSSKDDVASVFARSVRGEKEFEEFAVNQRAAVALARYLQDPLVEIAGGYAVGPQTDRARVR